MDGYECHVNGGLCPYANATSPSFTQSAYDNCMVRSSAQEAHAWPLALLMPVELLVTPMAGYEGHVPACRCTPMCRSVLWRCAALGPADVAALSPLPELCLLQPDVFDALGTQFQRYAPGEDVRRCPVF